MAPDFLAIAREVFADLASDAVITTERGGTIDYVFIRTPHRFIEVGYEAFQRPYCFVSLDEGHFGRIGEEIPFPAGESIAKGQLADGLLHLHERELREYLVLLLGRIQSHLAADG